MTEGIYNLCMLEVFNKFSDEVTGKVRQALRRRKNGCLVIELTAYADYCVKLLRNNGCDIERDADDILFRLLKIVIFNSRNNISNSRSNS